MIIMIIVTTVANNVNGTLFCEHDLMKYFIAKLTADFLMLVHTVLLINIY